MPLLTNVILGWKVFPGPNTMAYYEHLVNYGCKKFYNIGPGCARICQHNSAITGHLRHVPGHRGFPDFSHRNPRLLLCSSRKIHHGTNRIKLFFNNIYRLLQNKLQCFSAYKKAQSKFWDVTWTLSRDRYYKVFCHCYSIPA